MSRVLVIPDVHTKTWIIDRGLEMAEKHHADKIVLLGDYFDDWNAKAKDNIETLAYLKNLLKTHVNIIPLYGNHELSYMGFPCSGHIKASAEKVKDGIMSDYRFLYAVGIDGVLYTHAGVTKSWLLDNNVITDHAFGHLGPESGAETLEEKINGVRDVKVLAMVGKERGGNSLTPGPLWADFRELINDEINTVKQVVGHTPISNIECVGNVWFCDTYSNDNPSNEFLLVEDGEPRIIYYKEPYGGE